MKNLSLVTFFILIVNLTFGQHHCYTNIDHDVNYEIQQLMNQARTKNYNGQVPMVRLALHNIRRDDGTGGNSWADIRNVVQGIGVFFESYDICFTVVRENNIDDDKLFELEEFFGNTKWEDMVIDKNVTGAIDIYFIQGANSGGVATGPIYGDPANLTSVTLSNTTISNGVTWNTFNSEILAHELGHCLFLLHTHETGGGVEEIPRTGIIANCTTAGDGLCDTPADPNLNIDIANINEITCAYVGGATRDGLPYTPDTRNVMSRTLPDCMLNFSAEQGLRMRTALLNTTNYDEYIIQEDLEVGGLLLLADRYYGAEGTISTDANNNIFSDVVYEAGEAVILEEGFDISASANTTVEARIGLYDCLNPLIRNSGKLQNSNQPIAVTNGVSIIKSGDVAVAEIFDETLAISPNPFNNSFNLRFDLANTQAVSLVVYDALGRVVETVLMNDKLQRGNHQYKINGSNLENGLYYVTLKHSSGIQTIKVIKQ